jgi:hypothetical protein
LQQGVGPDLFVPACNGCPSHGPHLAVAMRGEPMTNRIMHQKNQLLLIQYYVPHVFILLPLESFRNFSFVVEIVVRVL